MKKFCGFDMLSLLATVPSVQEAFAMARPADPGAPPPPAWVQFLPFVVMIAVFYFLLIRPQSRQRKERQRLLDGVKKGDRVVTNGGIIGTVMNVNQNTFDLKIGEDAKVRVLKSAVSDLWSEQAEAKDQGGVTPS